MGGWECKRALWHLSSQASHRLGSNHIPVLESILCVSEEHPLGSSVSDKCQIEGFVEKKGGPPVARVQWHRAPELSEACLSITRPLL